MFGSQILEVALGVICLFIFMSTIASVIREGLESWMKTRAAFLERGIQELLHDKTPDGLVNQLYNHPHISSLFLGQYKPKADNSGGHPHSFSSGRALPSYIPTKNFALALMDMAARGPVTDAGSSDATTIRMNTESIRRNIANLNNPPVQRVMLTALDAAQGDLNKVQAYLENWFDSSMDRVSGWYRRSSQWVLFWIGLFISITLNVNPISVAGYLAHNDVARAAMTARAQAALKGPQFKTDSLDYYAAKNELESLALPIGWNSGHGMAMQAPPPPPARYNAWNEVLGPITGWLLMAIAITLGAPFWFDVLNKVMVIRSTVKPHEKSREESSADRQAPAAGPAPAPASGDGLPDQSLLPPPSITTGPATAAAGAAPAPANQELAGAAADPLSDDDDDLNLDGCHVLATATTFTADEHLPMTEGGVA